jgi:V/A-type H+-transporting ATPase subunit I
MFRPLRMRHVMIQLLEDDLPQASLTLAETGVFNPDGRDSEDHQLARVPGEAYRQIFRQAQSRLDKITEYFPNDPPLAVERPQVVRETELKAVNDRLGELWRECSECQEEMRSLDEEGRVVSQLESSLENFANLNIDLGMLQGDKTFLELHIGVVPSINLRRMEEALGLARFFVYTFLVGEGNAHVVVIGPKGEAAQRVQTVLESAGFHALNIPPELHDEPAKVGLQLALRRKRIRDEYAAVAERVARRARETEDFIREAKRTLALAEPYVSLDDAARGSSQLAVVSGWIPARELARVEAALRAALEHPFILTDRPPRRDEHPLVPSLLAPNRVLSPFTTLVTQYGVPRYGEIDPSAVFAVTFVLMFGMMFGDIGHGATIAVAALFMRRKLGKFTGFAVLAGLSSTAFGFLYGSIFGFEHVLPPLWMSPLSDPTLMLTIALFWGIGFLLLMTALSIFNRLIEGRWLAAVLETNGATSMMLYAGLIWGVYGAAQGTGFGVLPTLLIVASLTALAAYKWMETRAPLSERIMVVLVETFETVMGNVSSTLSFLRVAAFSLNHVALALAVFTLAEMMSPAGHWVMVVFGNLFILVLEGAIVAIQTLRLEYYEGFTRFYSGDGREFRPLTLNRGITTASAAN